MANEDVALEHTAIEEAAIIGRYEKRKEHGRIYSNFAPDNLYIEWMTDRALLGRLKRHDISNVKEKKILEVGCGYGRWLRKFINFGAEPSNMYGIDLLDERVEGAKNIHPNMHFERCNAENLPFPDRHFDIILQAVVFTSILDSGTKERTAHEMLRVLKDDGIIIWYDFRYNNPRNRDVRGIGRKEMEALFEGCAFDFKSVVLAPPITRLLAKHSIMACYLLEKILVLRTHYLSIIKKGARHKA